MPTKILVADDSATMRRVLEMTFAGEDARVLSVDGGEIALTKSAELMPDVVFADASMPGVDGYELCQRLKSSPNSAKIAVILMASQHHPYDDARGRAAGVDDHISKPFDSQAVIDRVGQVLSRPRAMPAGGFAEAPKSASTALPQRSAQPPAQAAPAPAAAPAPVRSPAQGTRMGMGSPVGMPPPGAQGLPPATLKISPPPSPAAHTALTVPAPANTPTVPSPAPTPMFRVDIGPMGAPELLGLDTPAMKPAAARPPVAVAAAVPAAVPVPSGALEQASHTLAGKLSGLGLNADQIAGVLALSREVIEQVVWEVVPDLAETLIREEIKRLTAE